MNRRMLFFSTLVCVLFVQAQTSLLAQSVAPGSNTKQSTAGIFGNDIDFYTNNTEFSQVDFDKGFLFAGLTRNTRLELGYATRLAGLHFGGWYRGNLLNGNQSEKVNVLTLFDIDGAAIVNTDKLTTQTYLGGLLYTVDMDNEARLLVGLGNMGFGLSFYQSTESSKAGPTSVTHEDTAADSLVKEIYSDTGWYRGEIRPALDFGMVMPMGANTLKPWAVLGVRFKDNNEGYKKTTTRLLQGESFGLTQENENFVEADAEIGILPTVGATFVLPQENGSVFEVSGSYSGDFSIFASPLHGLDGSRSSFKGSAESTYVEGNVENEWGKAVWNSVEGETEEKSAMSHTLNASATYTIKPVERLNLGARASLGFTYKSEKSAPNKFTYEKTVWTDNSPDLSDSFTETKYSDTPGPVEEISRFQISPDLALGLNYEAVPKKLFLNAGVRVSIPTYTVRQTTITDSKAGTDRVKEVDGHGNIIVDTVTVNTPDTSEEESELWQNWSTMDLSLYTGLTWNLHEKAMFDLGINVGSSMQQSVMDFLDTDISIMFTFKY